MKLLFQQAKENLVREFAPGARGSVNDLVAKIKFQSFRVLCAAIV